MIDLILERKDFKNKFTLLLKHLVKKRISKVSIYKFLKHPDGRINNLLKKILQLHPDEIHLSLDRIKILLKKLNNPQNKLPHSIHVAGTNGKGSVATSLYYLQKLNGKKSSCL